MNRLVLVLVALSLTSNAFSLTTVTKTVKSAGGDYTSLSAWEAGEQANLTATDEIRQAECYNFEDTTPVTIIGWTTDATRYPRVYTAASERHSGTWNTSVYRLNVANAVALTIRQEYTRLDGIQVGKSSSNANDQDAIDYAGVGTSVYHVSNVITKLASGTTYRQIGIYIADPDITIYIWNWLSYGNANVASIYNSGFVNDSGAAYIYSSTVIGGYYGVARFAGTITLKNTYASYFVSGGTAITGTITQTTCASSDTSATGTSLDSIAVNTTNFTNVTSGSENFHIPSGSALVNVGTDTSGESSPLNFTDDIDAQTRSGTWDVGADELVVAGGSAPPPFRRRIMVTQ